MANLRDLMKWFIKNNETLKSIGFDEKIKLQKLLYYSQVMHYAVYDTPLFSEKIEAWLHGPVVPAAYYAHEYTDLIKEAICASKSEINQLLDEDTKFILKIINFIYGTQTGKELEQLSHQEAPWSQLEELVKTKTNPEIKKDTMKAFYAPLKEVFKAYHDFNFEDQVTTSINGNNFTYNSSEMELNDNDVLYLWEMGNSSRDQSYYIHKTPDGNLEIIE